MLKHTNLNSVVLVVASHECVSERCVFIILLKEEEMGSYILVHIEAKLKRVAVCPTAVELFLLKYL
jgi:hypothetical protein